MFRKEVRELHEIEWVGTPNFRRGRNGRRPLAITNHITAGRYPGCLNWMQNPNAQASAHYLVTRTGQILQLVADEDTAWANGAVNRPNWSLYDGANPNAYTISIEHEGYLSNGGDGTLTEAQYQATLWLHRHLIEKWDIPITEDHIIGHYRIDSVNRPNCPGNQFPWNRLFADLRKTTKKGEMNMSIPEWKLNIMKEAGEIGLIDANHGHKPDEPATKWFVLAVCLNLLKILGRGK